MTDTKHAAMLIANAYAARAAIRERHAQSCAACRFPFPDLYGAHLNVCFAESRAGPNEFAQADELSWDTLHRIWKPVEVAEVLGIGVLAAELNAETLKAPHPDNARFQAMADAAVQELMSVPTDPTVCGGFKVRRALKALSNVYADLWRSTGRRVAGYLGLPDPTVTHSPAPQPIRQKTPV